MYIKAYKTHLRPRSKHPGLASFVLRNDVSRRTRFVLVPSAVPLRLVLGV